MKKLIIAVAILAFFAGMATARGPQEATPVPYDGQHHTRGTTVWADDMESGAPGWTHGDDSAQTIYWHIDSYMAYSGNSWWCGSPSITADGGYGNLWRQYLTSPYVDWTGYSYPVLQYVFRCDTEAGFDYAYAQAESAGAFLNLNKGYDGVIPWGAAGYYLGNKDNPARIRFYFESDGGYSDADGYYQSVGGAFAVDNVTIMDYYTATVLFLDDADANVALVPSVPSASGDFWTIASNNCQAYSDPHYWTCSSPDTMTVQPNLVNWLRTPDVDISAYPAYTCTLYFIQQMFMSGAFGGSWQEVAVADGVEGVTGWWYGHQCQFTTAAGPCGHYLGVIPIVAPGYFPSASMVAGKWYMLTDPDGNGCDVAACPLGYCSAGMNIDDTWIEVTPPIPDAVRDSSWGQIKSMYR